MRGAGLAEPGRLGQVAAVAAIAALGAAARIAVGLRGTVDADEATLGVVATRILHGHLVVMEPNLQYQGALEAYVVAPFVAVAGSTPLAVRLGTGLLGAAYVVAMYALGRALFERSRPALALAAVSSLFPLFVVVWGTKARWGYGFLLVLAAVILALATAIGWRGAAGSRRAWAGLGLAAGVGLWDEPLVLEVVAVVALVLLLRGPRLGWRTVARGMPWLCLGLVPGIGVWLGANLGDGFASLHNLPEVRAGTRVAAQHVVTDSLPIISGFEGTCDSGSTLPWWVAAGFLAGLGAAVVALRARPLGALLRGRLDGIEPVEMVLLLAPLALLPLVVGPDNGLYCRPRYATLLAVPLAVGATVVLGSRPPWRAVAGAAAAGWLVVAGVTSRGETVESRFTTLDGALVPRDSDLQLAMDALRLRELRAVVADYWLARPVYYLSGLEAPVGPLTFHRGLDPPQAPPDGWLVVTGELLGRRLEAYCAAAGISLTATSAGGLTLYSAFSRPVLPAELGYAP